MRSAVDKKNFWQDLILAKKPILALAPLAGFTDLSFRQICSSYGADVVYSEMASAAAIYYNQDDLESRTFDLIRSGESEEKNLVIQLFGSKPEHFALAARLVTERFSPAGIDINFGCPVPKVIKQGAGSALMEDLDRSRQVIEAVLNNTDLPVSIKIRTQSSSVRAEDFLKSISDLPLAALMIHGRSLRQGFAGTPDWDLLKRLKPLFNGVLIANGGLNNLADAKKCLLESGADGLGLARGALGRPWLFKEIKEDQRIDYDWSAVSSLMLRQANMVFADKGKPGLLELRKHLVWYVSGFPEASKIRGELVKIESLDDLMKILL
jgi:nifR3 family TIM-barrel protein